MGNETINVKGNFAVKVGKLWAQKDYGSFKLTEQPECLMSFAKAATMAQETGGSLFMFKPVELSDEQIADLKLAASNDEE